MPMVIGILLKAVKDELLSHNFRTLRTAIQEVSKGIKAALDGGTYTDKKPRLNFIQGTGIVITVEEDDANDCINITIGT